MISEGRIAELSDWLLAGDDLSPEEADELRAAIGDSDRARAIYLQRCEINLALGDAAEFGIFSDLVAESPEIPLPTGVQNAPEPVKQPRQPKTLPLVQPSENRPVFWQGIAALLVIGIGVFWFSNRPQPAPEVVEVPKAPEILVPALPAPEVVPKRVVAEPSPFIAEIAPTPAEPAPKPQVGKEPLPMVAEIKSIPSEPAPTSNPVEQLIGTVYRVSSDESNWSRGQEIMTGENVVNSSRVEFLIGQKQTGQNSIVAVQGPAKFSFITPEHFHLFSGKMSAEVSQRYGGFKVSTDETEVIDLGTRFAVTANEKGDSAVHVHEGKVSAGSTGKDESAKILAANQTVRFNPATREFSPIKFSNTMFATAPIQSGLIEWHNADLHVLDKRPADFDGLSPNQVHIFRESSRLELTKDLTVDILTAEKGRTLANGKNFKPGVIPAGTRISTYMMIFVTDVFRMTTPQIEVRFDSRILGIDGDKTKQATGPFAAFDRISPRRGHGIENAADTVEVERDGQTLNASFLATSRGGDSLRVIVLEN